jgi:hypothetical protein
MNPHQFAICVDNQGCDDLELLKLYQILPDASAEKENCLRVIDESGEDYIYPAACFVAITLSGQTEALLLPLFHGKLAA